MVTTLPTRVRNEIEAERTAHEAHRERMAGYLEVVRNSTLDDETRLTALMRFDSAMWRRRSRHTLIGEDVTPIMPPRQATTIQKRNAPKVPRLTVVPAPDTIKGFATELLQQVDDRGVGLGYDDIRSRIVARFPTVTMRGRHHGQPTQMPVKELVLLASNLKSQGLTLPFRPRRLRPSKYGPRGAPVNHRHRPNDPQ